MRIAAFRKITMFGNPSEINAFAIELQTIPAPAESAQSGIGIIFIKQLTSLHQLQFYLQKFGGGIAPQGGVFRQFSIPENFITCTGTLPLKQHIMIVFYLPTKLQIFIGSIVQLYFAFELILLHINKAIADNC